MVDQGAMFEIEEYLKNHTSTWFVDYRVWLMIIIILLLIVGTWWWFRKKKDKNKKNKVV